MSEYVTDADLKAWDFFAGTYMPTESQRPQRKTARKPKRAVVEDTQQFRQKPGKKTNADFKSKVKSTTEKAIEIVTGLGLNPINRGTPDERQEWRKAWATLIVTCQMMQVNATMNSTHEALAELENAPCRELFRQMWNEARNLCPYTIEQLRAIIKKTS